MSPVFLSCFSSFHLLSVSIRRFTWLTLHCIKFVIIDNNFPTQRLTQRSWWPHPRPHWPALYIPHPGDKPWRWTGHVDSWSVLLQWFKGWCKFCTNKRRKNERNCLNILCLMISVWLWMHWLHIWMHFLVKITHRHICAGRRTGSSTDDLKLSWKHLLDWKVVCIVKYGVRPITTLAPIYKTLIESASIVSDK